jgi:hypothetical protein
VLLPVGVVTLLDLWLPDGAYESLAWRIPFLAGIVLIALGVHIRTHVGESPEFVEARAEREAHRLPVGELFAGQVVLAAPFFLLVSTGSFR